MFMRNALIHCIGEIQSFLRKDVGADYEQILADKLSYKNENFGYTVKATTHAALEERMRQLSLGEQKSSDEILLATDDSDDKVEKKSSHEPQLDTDGSDDKIEKKSDSEIHSDSDDMDEQKASSEIQLDVVDSVDKVKKKSSHELQLDTDGSDNQIERKSSDNILSDSDDSSRQKSCSSSGSAMLLSSSNSVLHSSGARQERLPPYKEIRAVDSKKLCNGSTWRQHMQMPLDNFIACYKNSLQKFDLAILKRLILVRFLRAIETIESDRSQTDIKIMESVKAQVTEAMILLRVVREGAAYGLMSSVKVEHGPGEAEFHVEATWFTLDNIANEMLKIKAEEFELPCDIFELTNSAMQHSKNVLLLALNNGFKYMAGSFFTQSRALAIQGKYSSYNPKAYYDYPWAMSFLPKLALEKRAHWHTTYNELKSSLSKAKFTKDGNVEFPDGGESAYIEQAQRIVGQRQVSAALLQRNKLGNKEGLDRSYDELLLGLEQRYQSRSRVAY